MWLEARTKFHEARFEVLPIIKFSTPAQSWVQSYKLLTTLMPLNSRIQLLFALTACRKWEEATRVIFIVATRFWSKRRLISGSPRYTAQPTYLSTIKCYGGKAFHLIASHKRSSLSLLWAQLPWWHLSYPPFYREVEKVHWCSWHFSELHTG